MTTSEFKERLNEITQSLIAVMVIIGGGAALIFGLGNPTVIAPFVTLVIGFYFGRQPVPQADQSVITKATPDAMIAAVVSAAAVGAVYMAILRG